MKLIFENWRKHLNEGAVPHSTHHVVKKMKKTGLSAKEALKSLTTDLSDEEAERWLDRHKDEMESAKQDLDEAAYEPDPRLSHNLKTSFSDAELGRTLKEKFEDEAAEIAEQFNVEHSIEVDDDFGREPPPPDEENPLVIACKDGDRDACEDLEEEQELKREQLEVDSTWIVVGDQIYATTEEMYQDLRKRAGY